MSAVEVVRPLEKVELAHRRAARLVDDQRKVTERLDRFFSEVAEVREHLRESGSIWGGPILSPQLQAAFEAWQDIPEGSTRVEPSVLGPLPLMELE